MKKFSFGPYENVGNPNWIVQLNSTECEANKEFAASISPVVKKFITDNPESPLLILDVQYHDSHAKIVSDLLSGREVLFDEENSNFVIFLAKTLQIPNLDSNVNAFLSFGNNPKLNEAKNLENLVFKLSDDSFNEVFDYLTPFIDLNKNFLAGILFQGCVSRFSNMELYLNLVEKLQIEKEFAQECQNQLHKKVYLQESLFLLRRLAEKEIIDKKTIETNSLLYSDFFYTNKENYDSPQKNIFSSYAQNLEMNDFDLHVKYNNNGINSDEVAVCIRNDDVSIFDDDKIDFTKYCVSPKLYERSTYINQNTVPLLSYAAYFGSLNCFKILLEKGAKLPDDVLKYAACGGNKEIFDICFKQFKSDNPQYKNEQLNQKEDQIHQINDDHENIENENENENEDKVDYGYQILRQCIQNLIIFHRNEIFDESYNNSMYFDLLFELSIKHFNYHVFVRFLSDNKQREDTFLNCLKLNNEEAALIIADMCDENCFTYKEELTGRLPIHYACDFPQKRILKMLLTFPNINVNVQAEDDCGITPLHLASMKGNQEIVDILFTRDDLDLEIASDADYSALQYAKKEGFMDLALMLAKEGIKRRGEKGKSI